MSFSAFSTYKTTLKRFIKPTARYTQVEDIPMEAWYNKGARVIILDVDNTIMGYDHKEPPLSKLQWIERLKSLGFTIFLVSNNSSWYRIQYVAKLIGCEGLFFAFKPFPFAVISAIRAHRWSKTELLVIGDQLMTDGFLGKWLGVNMVLVRPMNPNINGVKSFQFKIDKMLLNWADS